MRRSARTRRSAVSSTALARWGGAAACLGGISYGAWGYLDSPDAPAIVMSIVVSVLSLITPTYFLGGRLGL
jgi:hypothetical protein